MLILKYLIHSSLSIYSLSIFRFSLKFTTPGTFSIRRGTLSTKPGTPSNILGTSQNLLGTPSTMRSTLLHRGIHIPPREGQFIDTAIFLSLASEIGYV